MNSVLDQINKFAVMIVIGAAQVLAFANGSQVSPNISPDIPDDLARIMKPITRKATIDDGVVRVIGSLPIVRIDMIRKVYFTYCYPVWDKPKNYKAAWGGRDLKRLEYVNSSNGQGIAFSANKDECRKLGAMTDDKEKEAFIKQRTFVCVAGNPCRERRPGERTAADD